MRIGLVGSGKIIHSCLDALSRVEGVIVQAVCVRRQSKSKGEEIQEQFGIPMLFTDYADLLTCEEIDFVYLGIPNNLHFHYTLQALLNGKNVICEKPFTSNHYELSILIKTAKEKNLFLFEAITNIHTDTFHWFRDRLKLIGNLKLIQCNYSQYSSRYDDYLAGNIHAAFDPEMSGGALYDINVYNIYLVCALAGMPYNIHYVCNKGPNGIDTSGIVLMTYKDFKAVCCGAKDSESPGMVTFQGDKGSLIIKGAPNFCPVGELTIKGGETERFETSKLNHMEFEFIEFNRCFAERNYDECYAWLDTASIVSNVLEKSREFARISFKV